MASLTLRGNDVLLRGSDLDDELEADLFACGQQGDMTANVETFLSVHEVDVDEASARDYLRSYSSAWDDEQLADHNANVERLVWLAGCMLVQENEIYFSRY